MPNALASLSSALSELVASVADRLVGVRGADGAVASGVVWGTGLVVTAHEALGNEDEFTLTAAAGETFKGEVAGRDPSTDVVVLKTDGGDLPPFPAAPTPTSGALAIVAGRGEWGPSSFLTTISEIGPAWRSLSGGVIDARILLATRMPRPMEGGAVFAPDGRLIGLAVAGPRRHGLVVPTATVNRTIDVLSAKGYVPRGYLGVTLHPAGRTGGAIVVGIEQDGPADRAGFLIGDIITTWNGDAVESVAGVSHRLSPETVGQTIKLGVTRGGSPSEVVVVVGERPRS